MGRLISFDISSDFGFFKKPDINKYSLTYNLPPKPAILGLLGAILGIDGLKAQYQANELLDKLTEIKKYLTPNYAKAKRISEQADLQALSNQLGEIGYEETDELICQIQLIRENTEKSYAGDQKQIIRLIESVERLLLYPQYYHMLQHIQVGVQPDPEKIDTSFPFDKIMNVYNSKNSYFGTNKYVNIPIKEQILIRPSYRIYLYAEENSAQLDELITRLQTRSPTYMPYLGKNEFIATITNVHNESLDERFSGSKTPINSIFIPSKNPQESSETPPEILDMNNHSLSVKGLPLGYVFYERHPISYTDEMQYEMSLVKLTSQAVSPNEVDLERGNLIEFDNQVIYVF